MTNEVNKRHIWFINSIVTVPTKVWVLAETEEEAKERFNKGAWHKAVPDFDKTIDGKIMDVDYAITKGPRYNK